MEFFLPFAFGDALCQLVKLLEPNSDSGTGLGKKLNQTEEEESIEWARNLLYVFQPLTNSFI